MAAGLNHRSLEAAVGRPIVTADDDGRTLSVGDWEYVLFCEDAPDPRLPGVLVMRLLEMPNPLNDTGP